MIDQAIAEAHRRELREGQRFAFGRNWRRFLRSIDEGRIGAAEASLLSTLERTDLRGMRFLDAGCGSGLSSLAALRAGASVTAFDFDPDAVLATRELLERRAPEGAVWQVVHGSVLDPDFIAGLGAHDVVYSWGVLHHTGAMWPACEVVAGAVPPGGTLFIALYNDAGGRSVTWARRKRRYVTLPPLVRTLYAWSLVLAAESLFLLRDIGRHDVGAWARRWRTHRQLRGMSRYRDWIDWIGGHPYEYTSVDEVTARLGSLGLETRKVVAVPDGGTGCNEFVLTRPAA